MLSKSCTEQDIREMFSQFGEIEQCTILRDSENRSKGCAFVTYATKQMALAAIRRLNQSIIMQVSLSESACVFLILSKYVCLP